MKKLNNNFLWLCKGILVVLVPAMVIIVFVQVILRYVFSSPLTWIEELARYCLVWISCFGAACGVREKEHIAVMFLNQKFKGRLKNAVTILIHLLVITFFGVCFYKGVSLSCRQWNVMTPAIEMPMTIPYLGIPLGFFMMASFSCEIFWADIKSILKKPGAGPLLPDADYPGSQEKSLTNP